jgi:hypothetical protein
VTEPTPAKERECGTKQMLMSRYSADLRAYIEATKALDQAAMKPGFDRVYERAMNARRAFEMAREVLNKHLAGHG